MQSWDVQQHWGISHIDAWDLQEKLRLGVLDDNARKHLLLVEHPHTITLGRGEKGQNLHQNKQWYQSQGYDVVEVNRGGEVTYHGPGQLVVYPVFHLQAHKLGIKDYVCLLEKCMLDTLTHFDLQGHRLDGHPGVYIDGKKIGSVGIHVRKFVSIHGLALNVSTDLTRFAPFTPCGIKGITMTSMQDQSVNSAVKEVAAVLQQIFLSNIIQ